MKTISIFIFPFVVISTLIAISCDKKNGIGDIDPPITPDSILMENLDNCDTNHIGQFTFEYLDSIYQFTNPSISVFVDSIPGSSYFLSDSVTFYKKTIIIKAPMNENEGIYLTIKDSEDPLSSCLLEKKYFESNYYYYENGLNYCLIPNPDNIEMVMPLCSSASASLKTNYENGVGYANSSRGSLQVTSCENGTISGQFENEFFKNGRFCKLNIEWR